MVIVVFCHLHQMFIILSVYKSYAAFNRSVIEQHSGRDLNPQPLVKEQLAIYTVALLLKIT